MGITWSWIWMELAYKFDIYPGDDLDGNAADDLGVERLDAGSSRCGDVRAAGGTGQQAVGPLVGHVPVGLDVPGVEGEGLLLPGLVAGQLLPHPLPLDLMLIEEVVAKEVQADVFASERHR